MLFNSWTFLLFFLAVFLVHQSLRRWRDKKLILLLASYIFYAAWNPPYVLILIFSTAMDWALARWISRAETTGKRRALLVVSLISNLGLLCFFKYGNFLIDNFHSLAETVGLNYQPAAFNIILPIGISFYTFASLSYTLDVYRRDIEADATFLDYALFVSFFPHLVAGPIVRASQLLPQIKEPRNASSEQISWGLVLLVFGLFAKVVVADNVFAPAVEKVYANSSHASAWDTWAAVLGFSGQIYYDFSGYSLCAIGLALCFGFAFPDNFRYPYAARGFSDFWHRWHITLSTWLRDYLYISLGGNRLGEGRTYLNLMLTMLIGGLWHGASWMFVLWGCLHGTYLAAERFARRGRPQSSPLNPPADFLLTIFTFMAVTLTWIPFRAPNMQVVGEICAGLFRFGVPSILYPAELMLCFAATAITLCWQLAARDSSLEQRFGKVGGALQTSALAACLIAMYLWSGGDERAFIYFQF